MIHNSSINDYKNLSESNTARRDHSIKEVKQMIQDRRQFVPSNYYVPKEVAPHLILRLRGEMFQETSDRKKLDALPSPTQYMLTPEERL
ncbi:ubiquitin-domain-containing protein [Gigaspora margarita]|uniref:Ubiquitin-domain-containing protein n=1 Tax=Gigaspora margarita TaxID=4874 RepID=A0A8H4A2K2_GIGMA|nr:ubiquitin-domain-containing protein [Gigaspora margarita]